MFGGEEEEVVEEVKVKKPRKKAIAKKEVAEGVKVKKPRKKTDETRETETAPAEASETKPVRKVTRRKTKTKKID